LSAVKEKAEVFGCIDGIVVPTIATNPKLGLVLLRVDHNLAFWAKVPQSVGAILLFFGRSRDRLSLALKPFRHEMLG
jgi:hypothetical protein